MGIFDTLKDTVTNTIKDQVSSLGLGQEKTGLVQAAMQILERFGGVNGLVQAFESKGLGDLVHSWVGAGANQPASAEQIQTALGPDTIESASKGTGVPSSTILDQLAQYLPKLIDQLTPNGQVPSSGHSGTQILSALTALLK